MTHKHQIARFAKEYLDSKGLDINTWLTGPKMGKRADVLALFLLSRITKSHCFVHLEGSRYWTSLEVNPDDHDMLLQKCNLHLAYLSCGNYAQLLLRIVTYEYEIFGVSSPLNIDIVDMKPQIIGSLTADEESTLSQLMSTGLKPVAVKTVPSKRLSASASARSERDLERVKREMDIPLPHIGEKNTSSNKVIKLSVEPLVKVKKMSKKDILLAQKRVRDDYAKLVSRGNTSKKSAKTNRAKRPGLKKKSGYFNVVVHKLKRRKCKYYYKYKIGECPASFSKTSAWNVHHLVNHKDVKFRCIECRKVLQTPSSYKNHLNLHKECHFRAIAAIVDLYFKVS